MDNLKTCIKCREAKPCAEFYRRSGSERPRSSCKECDKRARRTLRACINCGDQYWHAGSKGSRRRVCDECHKIGQLCTLCGVFKPRDRFYKHNRYCKDGCAQAYNRKSRYGVSVAQYAEMVRRTQGLCACCGRAGVPMVVDHCHDTGEVRGLICGPCNSGLGLFKDSLDALRGAVRYLEAWNARSSATGVQGP